MSSELEQLRQRVQALEQEHLQATALLEEAAQGVNLEKYAGDMVLYVDSETGLILDLNSQALEFLGYALKDAVGIPIDTLENISGNPVPRSYIEGSIEIQVYDCHFRHHQGNELPVTVHKRRISKEGKAFFHYALVDKSLRKQIWRELSRREDADYQFREKLKILNEINLELGKTATFDEVCLRSVELGVHRLGFDRMSVWFLDSTAQVMHGTFGVDETGAIRDERGQYWSFEATYVEDFLKGRQEPVITSDTAPLYNNYSEVVGYGWHITVPLLDGNKFIGLMGVDNY